MKKTAELPDRAEVSWFKSATSKTPFKTATLSETFATIEKKPLPVQAKIRELQKQIEQLTERGAPEDQIKKLKRAKTALKEKSWVPAFSLSVLFDGQRKTENIRAHTGCLQVDLDHLPSEEEWRAVCKKLQGSPHIWHIWRSISGDGIKAAALIPPDVGRHKDAFRAVADHVKEITGGYEIDEQCKDPARICFFSHSKVWTNPRAFPIEVVAASRVGPAATNGNGLGKEAEAKPSTALADKVRELAESLVGPLSEWHIDERGRQYAWCRCPDTTREHHFEDAPNTRVYLNPGSVPRIECRHGECATIVAARNSVLRKLWLDRSLSERVVELPVIEDASIEILKKIVLPPDVIRGLLHRGGKMVLGGGAKSFKTWQQLDICVSVAAGIPWLDFPTERGPTLYCNFELPAAFGWKRIQDVCAKRGVKLKEGMMDVMNLRGFAMDIENFIPLIIERVEANKPYSLIVLDPIYKLLGRARDENKAGDIAVLLNALERLAVRSGAAVLFGAHYSKGNQATKETIDRISGSGVFGRDPDTIFNFTRHEEADAYVVETILRNHAPVTPFVVRWEYPLMKIAKELDPNALKEIGGSRGPERKYKVDDWISKVPEDENISFSDLMNYIINATGCGATIAKTRLIPEAIIQKFIIKVGRSYRRGTGF